MDAFLKDLRYSTRILRQNPAFTCAALAAVALGIAANTAIFSVIDTVLLKPLPYPDPARIVMLQATFLQGRTGSASPTEFNWWRQHAAALQDISAYEFNVANWTGTSFPEQLPTMRVSADFLRLCGAVPLHGRTFQAIDDLPHAAKTVVLAWSFWQRRFAGDPGVIGRRMTLNGEPHEIIGIVGPTLENGPVTEQSLISGDLEIDSPPDVYLPFQIDPASISQGRYFNVAARLRPGVTLAAANTQLQASYPGYAARWPNDFTPGGSFAAEPLQQALVAGIRKPILILWSAVSFVLLIACVNVANLLLARAAGRQREIAIRAAVGAGRGRIVRQLLTESLVLSLAGGALGVAGGFFGIRALVRLLPGNLPRLGPGAAYVSFDGRVLGFTLAVTLLTGILFGLFPALNASRADLCSALKQGGARSLTGLHRHRTRELLVSTETALALVLLIGAALLIRTFLALRSVNPGFDPGHVLTLRMSLAGPQFAQPSAVTHVIQEGIRRIRALPGVEAAGTSCCVPLEDRLNAGFQIVGSSDGPAAVGVAGWTFVSDGYFEALRIPVVRGRAFTERDTQGPPVAIINQALARQFWPDASPVLGQIRIGRNAAPRQIIGVVGDVRDSALHRSPRPMLYVLASQMTGPENATVLASVPWAWLVRTRVQPMSLSAVIQSELRQASGGLPVARVRTLEQILSRSTATQTFNAIVLAIFGGVALLLAAIGIYGLISFSVAQRSHEFGIRVALGAESHLIRNMVAWQGVRPVLTGGAAGLAAAFGLTRILAAFLFGVQPWDPLTFVSVPLLLLGAALAAVWFPARRACRVDPIRALRCD